MIIVYSYTIFFFFFLIVLIIDTKHVWNIYVYNLGTYNCIVLLKFNTISKRIVAVDIQIILK